MTRARLLAGGIAVLVACGPRAAEVAGPPPIPLVSGLPEIEVVYPPEGSLIATRDSNFVFGSVGNGRARLAINDHIVEVQPNGAFLAWLPVPVAASDTIAVYELTASVLGEVRHKTLTVRVPAEPLPLPTAVAVIDSASLRPRGRWWVREAEPWRVRVRATPGATVRLLLPGGEAVPLDEVQSDEGAHGLEHESGAEPAISSGVYVGELAATVPLGLGRLSPDLLPVPADVTGFARLCAPASRGAGPEATPMGTERSAGDNANALSIPAAPDTGAIPEARVPAAPPPQPRPIAGACGVVEVALGADTARAQLPLDLWIMRDPGPVVRLREEASDVGNDGFIVGRADPEGTTLWMWSEGVEARVSGRRDEAMRIVLDGVTDAWVNAGEVVWLPGAFPPGPTHVGTVRIEGMGDRLSIDVSLGHPIPYQVEVDGRDLSLTLYGAYSATDWLRYGAADPFLESARWEQVSSDRYVLHLRLADQPWGYRVHQRPGTLRLEVRKPPTIDPERPLAGRVIAVDPGHPPAGATGPTGLYEGDANLAVALMLGELLEKTGARVILTRTDRNAVRLYDRTHTAEIADAEVLVSIHNNALPDGVNPVENNGTSVYYFHPFSRELAEALQLQLLRRLGLRDLGIGRASLALVRPTWMPSALTEGAFMMIPPQEAALRTPAFQEAYARGVLEGIRAFLSERAR